VRKVSKNVRLGMGMLKLFAYANCVGTLLGGELLGTCLDLVSGRGRSLIKRVQVHSKCMNCANRSGKIMEALKASLSDCHAVRDCELDESGLASLPGLCGSLWRNNDSTTTCNMKTDDVLHCAPF
jgi:hypothetical protein